MYLKHPFIKADPELIRIVLNHLSSFHPLSPALEEHFSEKLFEVHAKKGEYLLKQGETSEYLYFIVRGIIVGYTTRKGKKLTTYICTDGETVSSISGMYGESPSDESMYVVEDAFLLGFPVKDLLIMLDTSFEMNVIIRKILELFYKSAHERANLVRMGTAQEKYEHYVLTSPNFLDRVPSAYIADLLNIKPQTLSRILKERPANTPNIENKCKLIENYMGQAQAFKQQGLTLLMMANALSMSAHQLSQILNLHYKKGFNNFINGYRITYVKSKLLSDEKWQRMKIEALGIESGFSSRSAFFSEFKQHVGMSPAEFAKASR